MISIEGLSIKGGGGDPKKRPRIEVNSKSPAVILHVHPTRPPCTVALHGRPARSPCTPIAGRSKETEFAEFTEL